MDGNIIKKHESGIRLVVIMLITGIVLLAVSIAVLTENAHKQTIDVVSTVGVGSEFVFTLPKA